MLIRITCILVLHGLPIYEFSTPCLGALAFLSSFPYGKGDPTSNDAVRDVSTKKTKSFAQKLCHFIKLAKLKNGK